MRRAATSTTLQKARKSPGPPRTCQIRSTATCSSAAQRITDQQRSTITSAGSAWSSQHESSHTYHALRRDKFERDRGQAALCAVRRVILTSNKQRRLSHSFHVIQDKHLDVVVEVGLEFALD